MSKCIKLKNSGLKWICCSLVMFMYGYPKTTHATLKESSKPTALKEAPVQTKKIDVDLNALIKETQKLNNKSNQINLVWWTPEEYWQFALAQSPNITKIQIEEFLKVLRPYTTIAVVDGKVGTFAGITYKSKIEILSRIQIIDSQGIQYQAINDENIDADTKNFFAMMKPILANMIGKMGENMHFILFPAKNKQGNDIAAAKKEGTFSIKLGEKIFRWKLPLSSLFPPQTCPLCREQLSGTYKFCPWDGTKLSVTNN